MAAARLAAANIAFDGIHPVLRQSPPILWRSISTVGTPNAAAAAATDRPPGPPPITQRSGVSVSTVSPVTLARNYNASITWRRATARANVSAPPALARADRAQQARRSAAA